MKKIIVTCALLLLISCRHKMDITPTSGDSSPIIISDGSTVIRHAKPGRDYFTDKHPKKDEEIKAARYRPVAIGYQCDPSTRPVNTACPAIPVCAASATTPPTAPCRVDTSTSTSWDLSLCESPFPCAAPGTVHVTWQDSGSERMEIHSNLNDFAYTGPTAFSGAWIKHTNAALQSATLVVNLSTGPYTYVFVCAAQQSCLTVGYDRP